MSSIGQSTSASLDDIVADALLRTYGYRRVTELRGEYVIENHRVVSNTLRTVEVLGRDRSRQSSNPVNEWDEYEQIEAGEPDENPCDSGWCGDSACYRCNPWGYPR